MHNRHFAARFVVALAGAALLGSAHTAAMAAPQYPGAAQNFAGSQIAKHEGVHGAPPAGQYVAENQVLGHDVSSHQGDVDWRAASGAGARFVYTKATEGTYYTNPHHAQQYHGAHAAGMTRGSYHFANPSDSSGAAQANYFVDHGGGWSPNSGTLPGALDMEYNPYGDNACYGLDPAAMTAWIADFSDTYHARTARYPVIYTSTSWWSQCTGNSAAFGANPLWLARYAPEIGALPAGWPTHTIWQFAPSGTLPGDQNYFNGLEVRLAALAG